MGNYGTFCYITLRCYITLYYFILNYITLYYVTIRHVTSRYVRSRHVTLVCGITTGMVVFIVWDVYRIFISTSMLYHILFWRWYIIKFNKFMKLTKYSFDFSYEIDKIINLMKVMKLTKLWIQRKLWNWVKLWSFFREINNILKDLNLEKFIACYLSILFKSWSSWATLKYLVLIIYEIFNSIWPLCWKCSLSFEKENHNRSI